MPGDILDVTDLFAMLVGSLFLALWPFWLAGKFLGARWTVVIERDGQKVGREQVHGWIGSERRINEILLEAATGARGGQFTI